MNSGNQEETAFVLEQYGPLERDKAMATGETKTTNDLAIDRTAMAANRTLMAWVRTALSLISFGFTIYKFLDAAVQKPGAAVQVIHPNGPKRLGLVLIALGTISVLMGTVEYFQTLQGLNRQSSAPRRLLNFSVVMGALIGLLGLLLFVTIITNTELF